MRLLVTDPLSEEGLELLRRESGLEVDIIPGLSHEELLETIPGYHAIIIRSGTKVTADVIDAGKDLKVVGRAGVGVDNVDVAHATRRGVLVMNTPQANIISAAEHAMAMMMTLARNIVWAHASMAEGKWERKRFTGVELNGKTLGIVGIGRVGGEVAKRAKSFNMKLIGYDPFLPEEIAVKLGVRLMELEDVLRQSDVITVHAPKTKSTENMISTEQFAMMKPHVMLVNCARGGIVDEDALYHALKDRGIAGAAFDVYVNEPPVGSPLLELDNLVMTPHLGASTKEAQEKVSLEMAEHVALFLKEGTITNAINAPRGELDPELAPFVPLAEMLGSFAFQMIDGPVEKVQVTVHGEIATMNARMVTISALIGALSNIIGEGTNIINAEALAKEKGIQVVESKVEELEKYTNMLSIRLYSGERKVEVRGIVFPKRSPRIVGVNDFDLEVPLEGDFILTQYKDLPGVIAKVATMLSGKGINIARMGVGRDVPGGTAMMLISVDGEVSNDVLNELNAHALFDEARFIKLSNIRPRAYMD